LRRLIRSDATLEIVGATSDSAETLVGTYFGNYTALPWEWKLSLASVDGEDMIVHWRRENGAWLAHTAVRLWWADGRVVRIRDYVHVDYLLADTLTTELPSPA
jgi:hypothetical protein